MSFPLRLHLVPGKNEKSYSHSTFSNLPYITSKGTSAAHAFGLTWRRPTATTTATTARTNDVDGGSGSTRAGMKNVLLEGRRRLQRPQQKKSTEPLKISVGGPCIRMKISCCEVAKKAYVVVSYRQEPCC